jgi:hypothetical protein
MHPEGCDLNHPKGGVARCGRVTGVSTAAISASSIAEVSWVVDGLPRVRGVVPLMHGDVPVLALTYADEDLAREAAAAPVVSLSLTEPRSTGAAFRPLAMVGRPRLVEDPSGDLFATDLLQQELRRYPPSRVLADSPLLQREHWWYLPRLLVEIDVAAVMPLAQREDPARDHLLVVAGADGPVVRVARVADGDPELVSLMSQEPPPPGPAVTGTAPACRWMRHRHGSAWGVPPGCSRDGGVSATSSAGASQRSRDPPAEDEDLDPRRKQCAQ